MENGRINLIFDCDGTLIDSYGAISDTVHRLFLAHGTDCSKDYIREYSLRSTVSDCVRHLSEKYGLDFETMHDEYGRTEENRNMITLIPHAADVAENDEFRCFVYTHRGPDCRQIFQRLGILDCFVEIVDKSCGFKRKPDPEGVTYLVEKYGMDKKRTYYVGDRALDIECGINAGVGTIFLNSSGLDIDCSKADFVIDDLREIIDRFAKKS